MVFVLEIYAVTYSTASKDIYTCLCHSTATKAFLINNYEHNAGPIVFSGAALAAVLYMIVFPVIYYFYDPKGLPKIYQLLPAIRPHRPPPLLPKCVRVPLQRHLRST